jgi:ribonuclease P protein component
MAFCRHFGWNLGKAMNNPPKVRTRSPLTLSLTGSRLRKHADYQRAYAASRKRQSASMSWFLAPQSPAYVGAALPPGPRVGLTVGKVIGKSHERNRIKRRMREVLRLHAELLPDGFDLILHPRRSVMAIEFLKLEAEVVRILQQAKSEAARMRIQASTQVEAGNPAPRLFCGVVQSKGVAPPQVAGAEQVKDSAASHASQVPRVL